MIEQNQIDDRVSVVLITYNRANFLPDSIGSVLLQAHTNLELIVVDDGSSDDTQKVIDEFQDPRIKYYYVEHCGFLTKLRNYGIKHSHGNYIAFLDSDDIWRKDKISDQLIISRHEKIGFSFCDVEEFDEKGIIRRSIYNSSPRKSMVYNGNIFQRYIGGEFIIYPSTIFFKRTCLAKTGMLNEEISTGDNEFFMRLALHFEAFMIPKPLVKIRKHQGNLSKSNVEEGTSEMLSALNQFKELGHLSNRKYRMMKFRFHYVRGLFFLQKGKKSKARIEFLNCAAMNLFAIKPWVRYFQSFFN